VDKQKHVELSGRIRWINDWLRMATDVHVKISEEIAQELMEQRADRKVSRTKCADLMGVTSTHLFAIENSRVMLTEKIVDGYFHALNGRKYDIKRFQRNTKNKPE